MALKAESLAARPQFCVMVPPPPKCVILWWMATWKEVTWGEGISEVKRS